jgi:hypothetical protein
MLRRILIYFPKTAVREDNIKNNFEEILQDEME